MVKRCAFFKFIRKSIKQYVFLLLLYRFLIQSLPARGATVNYAYITLSDGISIHAPARGATGRRRQYRPPSSDFNPRSRRGSDDGFPGVRPDGRDFNPRSRRGSDATALFSSPTVILFQSTLPQGERPSLYPILEPPPQISIHAPARGATEMCRGNLILLRDFNPRSRKGSDVTGLTEYALHGYFNPRSRKGSDSVW